MFRVCSTLCAQTSSVPLLLFTSPSRVAQRAPSLTSTPVKSWRTVQTVDDVAQEFSGNRLADKDRTEASRKNQDRGAQRTLKKRGFRAVLRWCAVHQELRLPSSSTTSPTRPNELQRNQMDRAVAALDTAALQWVTENAASFSCSQQMVLISFLCDIACGATVPTDTEAMTGAAGRLAICRVVAVLVHRVNASEALETQPLALQLTAAYALQRLSTLCADTMSETDALTTIQAPPALFFSILHHVRGGTSLDDLCAQDEGEGIAAMLTFLLLMTPARRTALLRDEDHYLLRDVLDRLVPLLEQTLPADAGTNPTDRPSPSHRGRDAEPESELTSALDSLAQDPRAMYCGSVPECLTLLANIEFAKPHQRLACLAYYFRLVRPANQLSAEEMALLPAIFATVESISPATRMAVTDGIVSQCRVAEPAYRTVMGLLPFVREPMAFATARVQLTLSSVDTMPCADALQVLCLSGSRLPAALTHALVRVCLRGVTPDATSLVPTVPLTPRVVALLRCLVELLHADKTSMAVKGDQGHSADDGAAEGEGEEDQEEEAHEFFTTALRSIVDVVDWQAGLVQTAADAKPSRGHPHVEVLDTLLSVRECLQHTVQDESSQACPVPQWPSGEVFVERYVQPVLTATSSPHRPTLRLLVRVSRAEWLDTPCQRKVLEMALAISGGSTATALTRFIELFAADAVRLGVQEPGITKFLLKQRSLDPHIKLFSSEFTSLTGPAYGKQYVQSILTCCAYLLLDAAQMPAERKEMVRSGANQWLFHCLLTLASRSRRGADGQLAGGGASSVIDTTGAATTDSPGGQPGDTTAAADASILIDIDDAAFDTLLTYAVHFGCKPPPSLLHLLNLRMQQRAELSVPDPLTTATPGTSAGFPLSPACFVFAVRLDVSWPLPLTTAYLCALLRDCDLSIFATVVTSFLMGLKARRDLPDLQTDLVVVSESLRLLLERARSVSDPAHTPLLLTDLSTVARDTIRGILSHLQRTRIYEAPLRALRRGTSPPDAGSGPEHRAPDLNLDCTDANNAEDEEGQDSGERQEVQHASPAEAEPTEDGVENVGAMHGGDERDAVGVVVVDAVTAACHQAMVAALGDVVDLLEPPQLKELAVGNLDRLWELFPLAAEHVFARYESHLADLAPRELLLLAVRYPPAEAAVVAQLSHCDMRVHVDFGVFLRFAKNLPMPIVTMVAEAHLATLSFAWTARLASALSTRAECVATPLLAQILGRLEALSEKATDADRSLVLVILQHFIPPVALTSTDTDAESATTTATADPRARLQLVQQCCDKLLRLDSVRDMASLAIFLEAYPPTLRSMVQDSAVEQVQRCLLAPLVEQPLSADTVKSLTALLRLLHQHDLLLVPLSRLVYRDVIKARLDADAIAGLPLRVVVELTVLVGSARRADGATSAAAQRYGAAALAGVVERLPSPSARVEVLSTIVELRASAASSAARAALWVDPDVQRALCLHVLGDCGALSAREFATLAQTVSRLRLWGLLSEPDDGTGNAQRLASFHQAFPAAFSHADPHNRCVVLKAISSDPDLFHRHEATAVRFVQQDVPVLSHEDLELLLSALLLVRKEDVAEAALDAISTRLLPVVDQCRRSTLVRVMQCHAQFSLHDAALFAAVLRVLEDQCAKELRLDVAQVVTLLQAFVALQLDAPERLLVACFQQLEKASDNLTVTQQAQAAELLVALDMAYTPYVHTLVVKVLENREGSRHSARLRAAAERLCDAYDVEAPPHLRVPRLRKRRAALRLRAYTEQYAAQFA